MIRPDVANVDGEHDRASVMTNRTDAELIAATAARDDSALRELFERHAGWLGLRLRRRMPVDAVEDVVQETFLAVWRGAARYDGRGEAGGWIWGIARRQAAMWARSNNRPVPMLDWERTEDPEATAVRSVDVATALAALGPAGSQGRDVVELVYLEDRSVGEAAERLGIPAGTVKSRLFKARQKLRLALTGGPEEAAG